MGVKSTTIEKYSVDNGAMGIRPASNLKLDSVLFASSAQAATSQVLTLGTIATGTAMTLRLDGSSKGIGTVVYNAASGNIKATKGNISGNVSLVVQGNTGSNNVYCSREISGTDVIIDASEIRQALGTATDDSVANWKIWLETTDSDGMIYAVEATETDEEFGQTKIISGVAITGITAPVAGQPLDTVADCQSEGVKNTTPTVSWNPGDSTAKYGTSYMATVMLEAMDGYAFESDTTKIMATVNGQRADVAIDAGGNCRVTYTFPSTAKVKLKRIIDRDPITGIANGTLKEASKLGLPANVTIEMEDGSTAITGVNWDVAGCNYDPANEEVQTVAICGKVVCPNYVDANGVPLTTSITITVNAADVADTVEEPIASVLSGTYKENQTVILSSPTEGADIYYTTDGKDLKDSGNIYREGILVKADPGQTETTTIKAIATKNRVWSNMVTFTYTIDLTGQTSEEQAPAITSHPQNKAVKTGEQAVFTVGATGTNLTYQWQVDRNDGKGFVDIDGENSESYIIGVTDMACNGFRYQCVVSNSAGSVTSDIATLTVTDELTPPSGITYTITAAAREHGSITPSGDVEVEEGNSRSFVIAADEGYEIEALLVDGSKAEIASSYTFENVTTGHSIEVTFKQRESTSDPEKPDPNPGEKPKQEAKPAASAGSQAPRHEHNFRWVTVQTASAAQDGLEELRCDCEMVMESSVIQASQAYVNGLCQNLAMALENGSVTFDSGRIYTISDYIIKRLQDRADVTTTITFEYDHSKYRMIIPAGVDYTELLEDDEYFYGYFYFAKKVGARVETL